MKFSTALIEDHQDLKVHYIVDSINKHNKLETSTNDYKLIANDKLGLIEESRVQCQSLLL
jgi:sulfur relay (sulfurtransferase) complex TusBCD TusD component (DsrE family)